MPERLERSLWYDLSPMRPGEFEEMDAALWNTAMVDQAAYRKGIEQARAEAGGADKVTEMLARKQGRAEA